MRYLAIPILLIVTFLTANSEIMVIHKTGGDNDSVSVSALRKITFPADGEIQQMSLYKTDGSIITYNWSDFTEITFADDGEKSDLIIHFSGGDTESLKISDLSSMKGDNASSVEDENDANTVALDEIYPNPVNSHVTIGFTLEKPGNVTVDIYFVNGNHVKTLVSKFKEQGSHSVMWDGKDGSGKEAAPGVYFCRVKSGNSIVSGKIIQVK